MAASSSEAEKFRDVEAAAAAAAANNGRPQFAGEDDEEDDAFKHPPPPPSEGRRLMLGKPLALALSCGKLFAVVAVGIGSAKRNDCPVEPFVPVYLIVSGALVLLMTTVSLVTRLTRKLWWTRTEALVLGLTTAALVQIVLAIFQLGVYLAGAVLVFGLYKPEFDNLDSAAYCSPVVYIFSFAILVTFSVAIGLFVLVGSFLGCFIFIQSSRRTSSSGSGG